METNIKSSPETCWNVSEDPVVNWNEECLVDYRCLLLQGWLPHCTKDMGAFCREVVWRNLIAESLRVTVEVVLGVVLVCMAHNHRPQLQKNLLLNRISKMKN